MSAPNVLLVVWDACRYDMAEAHAPTLNSLGESNLWFENAVTPAGHSLPSHVSLMTGEYPHEHGIFEHGQRIDSLPLLTELGEQGYTRYGVSANGFASPKYGFDREFDEFYNTQGQMVFPTGLDIHEYGKRVREANDGEFDIDSISYLDLIAEIIGHDQPFQSAANVVAAGIKELSRDSSLLQKVPHPRFDPYSEFNYSPNKNTGMIEAILEREAKTSSPFFIFTNYMDTHRPYAPPKQYQREYCDRTFSYRELSELSQYASPWSFIERINDGDEPNQERLRNLRNLYTGEVRSVDGHLSRLLSALEEFGLREDTLVIVTADHGENLGETDPMGETRIGHAASASDNLLQVPLVVAHPEIDGKRVKEPVSTRRLYDLLGGQTEELLSSDGQHEGWYEPADEIVASQMPAQANEALLNRHPGLAEILTRHISVCYSTDWKVVSMSSGDEYAWRDGEEAQISAVPTELVEQCRDNLEELDSKSGRDVELSESDVEHLEALGYI